MEQPNSLKNLSVLSSLAAKRGHRISWYAIYDKKHECDFLVIIFISLAVQRMLLLQLKSQKMMWLKLVTQLKSVVKVHFVVLLNFQRVMASCLALQMSIWYIQQLYFHWIF